MVYMQDQFDTKEKDLVKEIKKLETENQFLRSQVDGLYGMAQKILNNSKDFSLISPELAKEAEAGLIRNPGA